MTRCCAWTVVALLLPAIAHAQARPAPPVPPDETTGYAEAVAQSAFGNVTSQSFGGEFGVYLRPDMQVFVEIGVTRDVATPDIGQSAQAIAGVLSQTQSNVGFSVKEPVTFGVAGVRYLVPMSPTRLRLAPYVLAGVGIARVKRDVTFTVNGTDVTSNLQQQFLVTLGSDLSGSFTRPMITLGGGVAYPVWRQLLLDFQFRYGRIFAPDQGINVSRAGLGLGILF